MRWRKRRYGEARARHLKGAVERERAEAMRPVEMPVEGEAEQGIQFEM
jgi:hypothetical protein